MPSGRVQVKQMRYSPTSKPPHTTKPYTRTHHKPISRVTTQMDANGAWTHIKWWSDVELCREVVSSTVTIGDSTWIFQICCSTPPGQLLMLSLCHHPNPHHPHPPEKSSVNSHLPWEVLFKSLQLLGKLRICLHQKSFPFALEITGFVGCWWWGWLYLPRK